MKVKRNLTGSRFSCSTIELTLHGWIHTLRTFTSIEATPRPVLAVASPKALLRNMYPMVEDIGIEPITTSFVG